MINTSMNSSLSSVNGHINQSESAVKSVDIGNDSKEIKYPGFGEVVENPPVLDLKQRALKVTKTGLRRISIVALGFPFTVPVAMALSIVVIYKISKKIFLDYCGYRYRLAFEPGLNNTSAPKLGEYTKVDLRVSNHATESYEWKKALISSAQQSIELSANFAGGEKFREVLQLIEKQMTTYPDLKCHLILSPDLLEKQDREYLEKLKQFYPNFHCLITDRIYTASPEILSEENHVKMLLVDGQYFVMGGTGIGEKMAREEVLSTESNNESISSRLIDKAFRDTDIIGCGDVAQTMRNQFFNLYRIWEHRMTGADTDHYFANDSQKVGRCELFHSEEGLIKDSSLKYIVSGPEHRQKNPISSEIAELARGAEKDIKIANLFFNPDVIVSDALKEAKVKNVTVQGFLNGVSKNASSLHYLYALPNRYNYTLLTEAFEYQKKDQLYHKKVMTVDSRYAVVGSFNLGVKSAKCDYENVCVINDERVTKLMNAALEEDAKASKKLVGAELIAKKRWCHIPSLLTIKLFGSLCG